MGQTCTSAQACCSGQNQAGEVVTATANHQDLKAGQNHNDIRNSFQSAKSDRALRLSNTINNYGSNAPPSGQPIDQRSLSLSSQDISGQKGNLSEAVTIQMPDGSTYSGTIDQTTKLKQGYGTQEWPDNAKYTGEWRDGKASGKGIFYHANGDVFEGNFEQDKANGFGKYIHKSGQTYEGDWVDDLQEGNGTEILQDGSIYVGQFHNGMKHGQGSYKWSDGTQYNGEWKCNFIDG